MSFSDIKLQDRAIQFIKNSLENKKLSHSFLFFGPDGVGKFYTANTLAKALNCGSKGPLDSCDNCPSCRKIERYCHPDVSYVRPEGVGNKIKIESTRSLKKKAYLKPFEGNIKFFIIEEAHLLTEEAGNSLLKILEEPPPDTVIILITDNVNKLLPTIRSRCQWVFFSPAKFEKLKTVLIENYGMSETDASFLASFSCGRIGKAISTRKRDLDIWRDNILDKFSKETAIFKEDLFFINKKREDILNQIDILITWYRDIFILTRGANTSLLINIDKVEKLKSQASMFSKEKIMDVLNYILKARTLIENNVNPKLVFTNLALML